MANYLTLSKALSETSTNLQSNFDAINSLLANLTGNLTGDAATRLSNDLAKSIEELKTQITYINSLANALKLIDDHKSSVNTLNTYKRRKENWVSDDLTQRNPYLSSVSTWQSKVADIERKIKSYLPSVASISSSVTLVSPVIDFSYRSFINSASAQLSNVNSNLNVSYSSSYQTLIDKAVNDWLSGFKNNKANLGLGTLSEYYTAEQVDAIIEENCVGATPRQRAVIAALTIIDLGADNGIRSKYIRSEKCLNSVSRPYDTEHLVENGADCASYLSWALDKSSSNSVFNNSTTADIVSNGTVTDYPNLQPGDIIKSPSHVAMIIENNVDSNYVIVTDASSMETGGYIEGVRVQKINYDHLKSNEFVGYDFSEFYGETTN